MRSSINAPIIHLEGIYELMYLSANSMPSQFGGSYATDSENAVYGLKRGSPAHSSRFRLFFLPFWMMMLRRLVRILAAHPYPSSVLPEQEGSGGKVIRLTLQRQEKTYAGHPSAIHTHARMVSPFP